MSRLPLVALILLATVAGCDEEPIAERIDNWISVGSVSPACSDFVYFGAGASTYGRGIVCVSPAVNLISVEIGTFEAIDSTIAWRPSASTCPGLSAQPSFETFGDSEGRLILRPHGAPVVYDRNDATPGGTVPGTLGPVGSFVGSMGCIRLSDWTFAEGGLVPSVASCTEVSR